jgi:hypothetical protein
MSEASARGIDIDLTPSHALEWGDRFEVISTPAPDGRTTLRLPPHLTDLSILQRLTDEGDRELRFTDAGDGTVALLDPLAKTVRFIEWRGGGTFRVQGEPAATSRQINGLRPHDPRISTQAAFDPWTDAFEPIQVGKDRPPTYDLAALTTR